MKSEERGRVVVVVAVTCYLVVCFLLSAARATSNVHTVWLEANTRSPPKSDPTGNSQRVFSQRTGLWSVTPQDALANSASSLQPAIVDQDSSSSGNSNRRQDSDQTISYVNDSNTPDLATTSDWPNHRGTNNGHVQFDEEAGQKSAARSSLQVNNSLNEQDELVPTEPYNGTTTTTNYITPTSQSGAVGFEDFASVNPASIAQTASNFSSLPSYEIRDRNRTNSNGAEQPALIYYLTDGDRWNHQQQQQQQQSQQPEDSPNQPTSHNTVQSSPSRNSFGDLNFVDRRWRPNQAATVAPIATTSSSRRKLHNSGTQYDLREFHHQLQLPNSAELELAQRRQQTNELHQQQQQQQHYQPERNLIQFIDQLAPNPRLLDPHRPNQATTPMPSQQIGRQVVRQRRPDSMRAPVSYVQSPLDGPLLVQHPQQHQQSHYYLRQPQIANTLANNRRQLPQQQQQQMNRSPLWRQRSSPSSNRNSWLDPQLAQRSFLQNYVPSIGRPKLKPTSILSSWMSSQSGGVGGSRQLENAFYSTASSEQRPWNAANYHYNYEQPLSGQHSQASRLYTLLNQPGGNKHPANYQRPTLAPASNFAHRPQHDMTQASQIRGASQQSAGAGFIPVVAVSVTKTSPVPMPAAHSNQLTDVSIEQPHAEMEPTVEYHHQAPATRVRRTQQQQAKVHFDDYGNYASGSSGDPATLVSNQQRIAYQPPVETTTVKSALFGYLPHEAERPLLGAMNLFTPIQQHIASDSNRATSLYQHQQSPHYGMDQQHLSEGGHLQSLEEPPTPLGLQLQANSYVQNDIAHPFGSNSIDSAADQRAPLFYLDGAGSSSSQQFAKHDIPIVQSHHGLMNALLADGSLRSPHLIAAASEISPLVPVVFASPQQSVSSNQGQDEAAESGADQDRHQHHVGPTRGSSTLSNKGNKKRSGDFFASAGQLFLSALPLLLAPTLGLMFASTPTAVARYQGQNSFGDTNGLQASAIPSSYMSGLNQGIVSNASPAPLLFTPSPLNKFGNTSGEFSFKTTPTTAPPIATTSTSTTTLTPTNHSNRNKQHRPTLGPVQTLASWTGSTPPPPPSRNYSIILTTLAPPAFSSTASAMNNKSRTSLVDESSNGTDSEHHATHTILLIQSDLDGQNSSETHKTEHSSDEKVKSHYDIGGYEGVDFDAQFPSLRKAPTFMAGHKKPDAIQQDITEAQKERDNDKNRYHYSQTFDRYPSIQDNLMKHSHISMPNISKNNNKTTPSANYDDDDDDSEDNLKLFPVSRWPTMHRRTVSLVTSNGNKTMPDSSDKYSMDLADVGNETRRKDSDEPPLSNKSLYPTMQQVHRGRIKRSLNFTTDSNEIVSHANITLKGGKKLVKVVKRRKIKRPKEQSTVVLSSNSSSANSDPMLSESSSGRVRFEQDSIGKRGDHRSDSTKHIIATMVAQMNDSDEATDNESDQQLREHLLRKKIMLDRLATSSMYTSPQETKRHELAGSLIGRRRHQTELEEEEDLATEKNLSSGGRGRVPSLPLEVASSKKKPRKGTEDKRVSDNLTDDEEEANLVLTDDTRKALTKLGNLLIKDTLQIPVPGKASEEESTLVRSRKESPSKRRKSGIQRHIDEKEEDADEPVATERNFARTTPYPAELRSLQYRQEPNNSFISPFHHDNRSYSYTGTQQYQSSFPPIRDQVNLIPDDHIGGGYGPPDDGRFGSREDRRNDYGAPIVASRYAQPDRYNRSDPYSNYSSAREPPPPSSGYGSYYSRPAGREPPPSRSYYDSRGHHYPSGGYPHNGSAYPPPNHRPSDDYYDSRRDNYSPPAAYPGPDDHQHYNNNNNKYPADPRYPAASHEHESWPPRASSQDLRDYQPGYGRSSYPSLSSSLDRDRDREPAYTSPPPTQQVGPPMGRTLAGDSSAVNEYLKRVQFSDSDRDKLMASYLTCDGLLNDNDHCLERLSCEFSDLKNIAQANKLDRAVSSILLGHILINTYIPLSFKQRLKTASIFGYTNSGGCSKYVCNKLT